MVIANMYHSHLAGSRPCVNPGRTVLRDMVSRPGRTAQAVSAAGQRLPSGHLQSYSNIRKSLGARNRAYIATQAVDASSGPSLGSKGIVITGGSKGLGYAMAEEFLVRGDRVVLCARDASRLNAAMSSLHAKFSSPGSIQGITCDVSNPEDVARLGAFAQQTLGDVHIWVNNAGQVTSKQLLADVPPEEILSAVGSNVVGSLLGCREAIRLMRQQAPSLTPAYHVFNLGFSSWGASFSKSAVTHKATKTALTQLTVSLAEELRAAGVASVGVHNLSPGMVLTDLLLKDANPVARRCAGPCLPAALCVSTCVLLHELLAALVPCCAQAALCGQWGAAVWDSMCSGGDAGKDIASLMNGAETCTGAVQACLGCLPADCLSAKAGVSTRGPPAAACC